MTDLHFCPYTGWAYVYSTNGKHYWPLQPWANYKSVYHALLMRSES